MATIPCSNQSLAVVTGAGSGIGRAFAQALAERGGRVLCSDINRKSAEQTVRLIQQAGGEAKAAQCDVSRLASVEKLAETAMAWFGTAPTLVVNNAGVGAGGDLIGETPMADWQWVMGVNLWGVIHGCHVFAPLLREQDRGGIINVCSTASFSAAPRMGPYNTSKAAVLALSETLAAEFSGTNVRVTALCPTLVKTRIGQDGRLSGRSAQLLDQLMQRIGISPERAVRQTLEALDRGRLYALPQFDARMIWRGKRYFPGLYSTGAGLLGRYANRHLTH